MPGVTFWSCQGCRKPLGEVRRNGALHVASGGKVTVPAATAAGVVVIVTCPNCSTARRWSPTGLPGFEVKAG